MALRTVVMEGGDLALLMGDGYWYRARVVPHRGLGTALDAYARERRIEPTPGPRATRGATQRRQHGNRRVPPAYIP